MSALGQKQTFAVQKGMSASPPKADIPGGDQHDCFVPIADIAPCLMRAIFCVRRIVSSLPAKVRSEIPIGRVRLKIQPLVWIENLFRKPWHP
jgi:hypothetical protein